MTSRPGAVPGSGSAGLLHIATHAGVRAGVRVAVLMAILTAGALVAACEPNPMPSGLGVPASPVEGVVVAVDSAGLGQVRAFTLRTREGVSVQLRLGPLENAADFSPSHIAEHQATSEPVRAWYRLEDGEPVVYRLEDAG